MIKNEKIKKSISQEPKKESKSEKERNQYLRRKKIKQEAKQICAASIRDIWTGYAFILILSYLLSLLVNKIIIKYNFSICLITYPFLKQTTCAYTLTNLIGDSASLLCNIIIAPLSVGFSYYMLSIIRKENHHPSDIFRFKNEILTIIGFNIISTLLSTIGYVFLIIPGIIIALCYSQASFVYADKKQSIKETLKESRLLMKGHKMEYIWFVVSFAGWLFLTLITFGIAGIWFIPYYQTSQALYYDELKKLKTN